MVKIHGLKLNAKRIAAFILSFSAIGAARPAMDFAASETALTAFAESAYTEVVIGGALTYHVYSDHCELFEAHKGLVSCEIPSEIEDKPVTVISDRAFSGCTKLTDITLPDSLIYIRSSAFKNCSALTSIVIPDSVTSIGNQAFSTCEALENVKLSNNLTELKSGTFYRCSSFKSVTIPDSVTVCSGEAFTNCTSLTEIIVGENNTGLCSVDGILFDKNKTTLKNYPSGITDEEYSVPDGVEIIESGAFSYNQYLKNVNIPDSVTDIGSLAFFVCEALEGISLPDGITEIKGNTFGACYEFGSVRIPSGVSIIDSLAFQQCNRLTSVVVPESTIEIGFESFSGCWDLSHIYILNPDCEIYDAGDTICNSNYLSVDRYDGTIYGYSNSTAQAHAEKYGFAFKSIDNFGDVNLDGAVNALDASLVLTEYASTSTGQQPSFNDITSFNADVDFDLNINSLDASYILSYYSYTATGGEVSIIEYLAQ